MSISLEIPARRGPPKITDPILSQEVTALPLAAMMACLVVSNTIETALGLSAVNFATSEIV